MTIETTVNEIINRKRLRDVKTIQAECTVYQALGEMAKFDIGALLVMEGEKLVGIISERDYSRKVALKNRGSHTTKVCEIMEEKVPYVVPTDTAESCMALMTARKIRHLPVLDNNELVGLISIGDVVKAVVEDRGFLIDQLFCYATGSFSGQSGIFNKSLNAAIEARILSA